MDYSMKDSFRIRENYRWLDRIFPDLASASQDMRLDLKAERSPDIFALVTERNRNDLRLRIVND